MLRGLLVKKENGEKRPNINRGIELMLRQSKKEESEKYNLHFSKMISLFSREFHFTFSFKIK